MENIIMVGSVIGICAIVLIVVILDGLTTKW